jgi:hypothetical protein
MEFCMICFDPLDDPSKSHQIVCVECNLDLHDECFNTWLDKNHRDCPHCRANLFPNNANHYDGVQVSRASASDVPAEEPQNFQVRAIIVPPPTIVEVIPFQNRISPSQEEIRNFSSSSSSSLEPSTVNAANVNSTTLDRATPDLRLEVYRNPVFVNLTTGNNYFINYIMVFFVFIITLFQEYLVWNLHLEIQYFVYFFLTNSVLLLFSAVLSTLSFFPFAFDTGVKFPLISYVLVTIIMSCFRVRVFLLYDLMLAWIFNVNTWNVLYLVTIFVLKVRHAYFY